MEQPREPIAHTPPSAVNSASKTINKLPVRKASVPVLPAVEREQSKNATATSRSLDVSVAEAELESTSSKESSTGAHTPPSSRGEDAEVIVVGLGDQNEPEADGQDQENRNKSAEQEEPIKIDAEGDLYIKILGSNAKPSIYLVSSACIRRASPKWGGMFKCVPTSDTDGILTLDLGAQDREMIELLLHIAHLGFKRVPSKMTFDQLTRLATTCRTNETAAIVRPFLKDRTWPWLVKVADPRHEQWIYIAYDLGLSEIFHSLSPYVAVGMHLNEANDWIASGGMNLSKSEAAGPILTNLVRIRTHLLTSIINACYDIIDYLTLSKFDEATMACLASSLGSMLQGLRALSLWPERPTAESIRMSVAELRTKLNSIQILQLVNDRRHLCGWECNVADEFRDQVFRAGTEICLSTSKGPKPVSEECGKHLKQFSVPDNYIDPDVDIWEYQAVTRYGFFPHDLDPQRATPNVDSNTEIDSHGDDSEDDDYEPPTDLIEVSEEEYFSSPESDGSDEDVDYNDVQREE